MSTQHASGHHLNVSLGDGLWDALHVLADRTGESVARTETDLKRLFPKDAWNKLHLQIIFYGREFCTARGCDGRVCPLCQELYPKRRKPVLWQKA